MSDRLSISREPATQAARTIFYNRQRSRVGRGNALAIIGITIYLVIALRVTIVLPWALILLSQVAIGILVSRRPDSSFGPPSFGKRLVQVWGAHGPRLSWAALPLLVYREIESVEVAWLVAFFIIFGLAADAIYLPQTHLDNRVLLSVSYCIPAVIVLALHQQWLPLGAIVGIFLHVTAAAREITEIVDELIEERVVANKHEIDAQTSALTDSLTGLRNRAGILVEIERLQRDSEAESISVCFVDLDDFKSVNDQLGYRTGDDVLNRFGQRLQASLPETWRAGRFGGDEFVAVGPGTNAAAVADVIASISIAPKTESRAQLVKASVGTYVAPLTSAETLPMLHHAGSALREAKLSEKNSIVSSDKELRGELSRRRSFERDLAMAVEDNDFVGFVQPQFDLYNGQLRGVEVLARWPRSEEIVGPGDFVPVIERLGLGHDFDLQMLRTGLDLVGEFPKSLQVSVNVTMTTLSSPDFLAELGQELTLRTAIDSSRLTLEVTETDDMKLDPETLDVIAEILSLGPQLSIDDFGTGYSSITRLVAIPFSEMKLDISLIRRLHKPDTRDLIETLSNFAERQNLDVVAEGVEDQWQADDLRKIGVGFAQGYLYSPPVQVEAFVEKYLVDGNGEIEFDRAA